MRSLYFASVTTHILAATIWIGGMLFLVLVVVPWLRGPGRANASAFLRETGERFRTVGWICFAVLLATGTFNLWFRGVTLADLGSAQWLSSPFGTTVLLKLAAFAAVLVASAVHDFLLGPRATVVIANAPDSPEAHRARRRASRVARVNVVLALVLVSLGVVLVRGSPW